MKNKRGKSPLFYKEKLRKYVEELFIKNYKNNN